MVKIFDISNMKDRPVDGTFDLDAYERGIEDKLVPNHGKPLPFADPEETNEDGDNDGENDGMNDDEESKEPGAGGENDWSDDSDSDDDDDDSDSDMSEGERRRHKPKSKKLNPKGNNVALSKKMLDKEKAKDFFKDL